MGRRDREKSDFGELAFYCVTCVFSYVISYALLVALLKVVSSFVVIGPYPRLFLYLLFFVLAWHIASMMINQIDR